MNNGMVIRAMQDKYDELLSKYNDAVEDNRKWAEWAGTSRCIYCDKEFHHDPHKQDEADELKKAHSLACDKHPLAMARKWEAAANEHEKRFDEMRSRFAQEQHKYETLVSILRARAPFFPGSKYEHFDQCVARLAGGGKCDCGTDALNAVLQPNICREP